MVLGGSGWFGWSLRKLIAGWQRGLKDGMKRLQLPTAGVCVCVGKVSMSKAEYQPNGENVTRTPFSVCSVCQMGHPAQR